MRASIWWKNSQALWPFGMQVRKSDRCASRTWSHNKVAGIVFLFLYSLCYYGTYMLLLLLLLVVSFFFISPRILCVDDMFDCLSILLMLNIFPLISIYFLFCHFNFNSLHFYFDVRPLLNFFFSLSL